MLKEQQDKEKELQASRQRLKKEEALASLVMSDQRQKRLLMLEEIEQVQCDIHNKETPSGPIKQPIPTHPGKCHSGSQTGATASAEAAERGG